MRDEHLLNDRYRLVEILGSSAVSVVWRAHDEALNRIVAVRVFGDAQAAVHDRLGAEAQAAATLSHPHVIEVFDHGEALGPTGERLPFLVTELVTGRPLADPSVLASLSAGEALTVCAQVADALTAIHQHGLVHGEVQPSNVVLTPEGAKLLDLGAATASRVAGHDEYAARRPPHWAPERVPGGDVSPAADVYALGVLMYWLLTDQPAAAPHAVPAQVADICHRCLASAPEARPTAADVATVLSSPPSPSSAAPRLSSVDDDTAAWLSVGRAPAAIESHRDRRRRSPVAILVGAAVVLLVGVVAALALTGSPDDPSATGETPTRTAVDDGASPTYPSPTTPASTPSAEATPLAGTTPAQPPAGTLTAVGGTVQARCQGNAARLVAAQPAAGFAVADSNQRGNQIEVVFTSPTHRSEVRVKCGPQGLDPTIRETELPAP